MFFKKPRESESVSWLIVALWMGSIFALIPIARTLQKYINQEYGREIFLYLTAFYLILIFTLAIASNIRHLKHLPLLNAALLIISSLLLLYWGWSLRAHPERTIHFIQYGTLSILIYRSLIHRFSDCGIYLISILSCFTIGTLDEIVQWATPERFFDYEDILINGGVAILVQFGIGAGIRPKLVEGWLTIATTRKAINLFIFELILLSFCFINTPDFVNWYADKLPSFKALKNNPSTMSEYGYLYQDKNIGIFRSRLSPDELKSLDLRAGDTAGALVNQWYDPNRYHWFLATYDAFNYPLAYELRVRLFRRDAYWGRAKEVSQDSFEYQEAITIAFKEHQILSRYYPVSYKASGAKLTQETEEWMLANQLKEYRYTSPVGGHIISTVSKRQALMILGFLCVLMVLIERSVLSKKPYEIPLHQKVS